MLLYLRQLVDGGLCGWWVGGWMLAAEKLAEELDVRERADRFYRLLGWPAEVRIAPTPASLRLHARTSNP